MLTSLIPVVTLGPLFFTILPSTTVARTAAHTHIEFFGTFVPLFLYLLGFCLVLDGAFPQSAARSARLALPPEAEAHRANCMQVALQALWLIFSIHDVRASGKRLLCASAPRVLALDSIMAGSPRR